MTRRFNTVASILALAAAYFCAGKFGLSLAFVNASASAVWPPTGLALAAILLWGYRLWPGVFLGAFLVNITTQGSLATTLGIATGNTLEALLGAWWIHRFANGPKAFARTGDVFRSVLLAATLSTALCATMGVASLCLTGFARWEQYPAIWFTWWLGDMAGDLIIAPLLLIWLAPPFPRWEPKRVLEAAGLFVGVILVGRILFLDGIAAATSNQLKYLAIPPLLWAAFRFRLRGAISAAFALSGLAMWGALHHFGPFVTPFPNQSLLLLQAFTGTTTLIALVTASVVSERASVEQRLQLKDAVSRALAEASTLRDATPKIIQALCEMTRWDAGAIWRVSETVNELVCVEFWHLPSINVPAFEADTRQRTFAPGIGLPGRVWRSGEPAWVPDVTMDNNFPRAPLAMKEGLRGAFCFPIKLGDEVLGVVECFSRTVREPNVDFLRMLAILGGQLGQFLERTRAEENVRDLNTSLQEQLDEMSTLMDILPMGVWIGNRDCSTITGNRAAYEMLGFAEGINASVSTAAPEVPSGLRIFIDGLEVPPAQAPMQQVARTGKPWRNFEQEIVFPDGMRKTVYASVAPLFDQNGHVRMVIGAYADFTVRKRTERALRESEERFRDLADTAPVLIWMSGTDKLCNYFNKTWLEFTGRSLDQEYGNGWAEGVHPDDLPRCLEIYVSSFDARREFEMEYRLRRRDGQYRWIIDHGVPRFASEREFVGYIGSCIDITESKLNLEELRLARSELEIRVHERTAALARTNENLQTEILAHQQTESALRANEAKFRGFVESAPDATVIVDQHGQIVLVNSQTERIFGYRREELFGKPLELLMPKRYHQRHAVHLQDFFADPHARSMGTGLELFGRRKNGTEFPVEISLSPLQTEEGVLVCSAIRDITDRKHADELLRRSERNLSTFFEHAPVGLEWLSPGGIVLRVNQTQLDLMGYPVAEYLGRQIAAFHSDPAASNEILARLAAREKLHDFRVRLRRKDGSIRHVLLDADSLWEESRFVHSSIFTRDITDRVELEQELLEVGEREQRRIAQDLHDGLGQLLSGTVYLTSTLQKTLALKSPTARRELARILELLDEALTQTRGLARGLHPVKSEPNGLRVALKDLASRTRRLFRVSCRFICSPPVAIEDNVVANHLYRIAQEAITNAVRHGKPERIEIGLAERPDRITLAVKDNGVGLSTKLGKNTGMGLRIMHYRAETIGGSLAVRQGVNGGTSVLCSVPKPNQEVIREDHTKTQAKELYGRQ